MKDPANAKYVETVVDRGLRCAFVTQVSDGERSIIESLKALCFCAVSAPALLFLNSFSCRARWQFDVTLMLIRCQFDC